MDRDFDTADLKMLIEAINDFSKAAKSIIGLDIEALNRLVSPLEFVVGVLASVTGM